MQNRENQSWIPRPGLSMAGMNPNAMIPMPGAATMANPHMIAACRAGYTAAALLGDPRASSRIYRAWERGNARAVVAELYEMVLRLGRAELWRHGQDLGAFIMPLARAEGFEV